MPITSLRDVQRKFDEDVEVLKENRDIHFYSIRKFQRPTIGSPKPPLPKYLLPMLPFDVGPNNLFRAFKVFGFDNTFYIPTPKWPIWR
jgi:hypothetical protein